MPMPHHGKEGLAFFFPAKTGYLSLQGLQSARSRLLKYLGEDKVLSRLPGPEELGEIGLEGGCPGRNCFVEGWAAVHSLKGHCMWQSWPRPCSSPVSVTSSTFEEDGEESTGSASCQDLTSSKRLRDLWRGHGW